MLEVCDRVKGALGPDTGEQEAGTRQRMLACVFGASCAAAAGLLPPACLPAAPPPATPAADCTITPAPLDSLAAGATTSAALGRKACKDVTSSEPRRSSNWGPCLLAGGPIRRA